MDFWDYIKINEKKTVLLYILYPHIKVREASYRSSEGL